MATLQQSRTTNLPRRALLSVALFVLLLPLELSAAFHFMNVKEVYGGSTASPNTQYVVLQMYADGQNFVGGHLLIFFNAAGVQTVSFTLPSNVPIGTNQSTILIATADAQVAFGITADFTLPGAFITRAGGKLCFDTIDCVAWGNYAGSSIGVGNPFSPGGGIPSGQAIRRRLDVSLSGSPTVLEFEDDTNDSAFDFRAVAPNPINNAGQTSTGALVHVSDATGSDTNPGSANLPVKTIGKGLVIVAGAGGGVIRVAQSSYPEKVTMVEGVTLLGGYQCSVQPCSWTRNPAVNDTAIINVDFEGVLAPNTLTRATRLDGFRIVGMSGTPSVAPGSVAVMLRGGTATIAGNRIFGGNTTGGSFSTNQSIGIAIVAPANSAQGSLIDGNQITGGSAASTTSGILFDAGSPPGSSVAEIVNNTILGGTSAIASYGILAFASASGTVVRNNDINAGTSTSTGSGQSWAVYVASAMTIDSNRINKDQASVGTCSGTAWCGGILVSGTANITNNLILGAKAPKSAAVLFGEFEVPIGTIILNANYLDGGGVGLGTTFSTAIALQKPALGGSIVITGRIRNNILLGGQNQNRFGIYEDSTPTRTFHPQVVENNDFHFSPLSGRTDVLYRSYDGTTPTNQTTLPPQWTGSFVADPLVDATFHLTALSPCVDTGTATEAPAVDFEGDLRPQGTAIDIGPDEQLLPATTLTVAAPANAVGGASFSVTVTARTATNSVATGYRGTVHFTSDDAAAVLPPDYAFLAADSGVHAFAVTLNTAGSKSVVATDTTAGSISGNAMIAVSGNTTTALSSSVNPSLVGQSVTFTATVTSPTIGTITGTVTFKDGTTTIGTGPLGSSATFATSALSEGGHQITAVYGGSANFATSTSAVLTQNVNLPPFGPPPGFSATADSTTSVSLSWQRVANATSYEVIRSTSILGPVTALPTTANGTTTDSNLTPGTTYLYRVRAIGSLSSSDFTAIDIATTIVYVDVALAGVTIKAEDVGRLRAAVNAVRLAANLAAATFTDSSLAGVEIKRIHLTQLRTALDEALAALNRPAMNYTDQVISVGVTTAKAAHWLELRGATQ